MNLLANPKENCLKYTEKRNSRYKDVTLYIYRTTTMTLIYTAVLNCKKNMLPSLNAINHHKITH